MTVNKVHLLAIAAHPDDIELGCAGTLLLHARKGQKTAIVDLTKGELGTRGTPQLRMEEALQAAKILGATERKNAELEDGYFRNTKEELLKIVTLIRYFQPELIIANALEDRHPDHGRAGRMIADACFLSGLRKVQTTYHDVEQEAWRPKRVFHMIQDRNLEPSFVIDISTVIDTKMEAIKAFKSQFYDPNNPEPLTYISTDGFLEQILSRSSQMGKRIGAAHGEGFVVENTIGLVDLNSILLPAMV